MLLVEEAQRFAQRYLLSSLFQGSRQDLAKIDPVVIDYLVGEPESHMPTFVEVAAIMNCMNELARNAQGVMGYPVMRKILESQVALQAYLDHFYPGNPTQYIALQARAGIPHVGEPTLCEMRQLLD